MNLKAVNKQRSLKKNQFEYLFSCQCGAIDRCKLSYKNKNGPKDIKNPIYGLLTCNLGKTKYGSKRSFF